MGQLDFDALAEQFEGLSTNAQATLLFRLVKKAGPAVLRSNIRYSFQSLDKINANLPDGHPYKERYKQWKNDREDKTHHQPAGQ